MCNKLVDLFISMKIKDNNNNNQNVNFGKSLENDGLTNIVKQRIKYITKNYNKEYIDYLKTEFSKYKNIILNKNIFENNFSLLDIKNITQIPLVDVPLNINIKE